MVETWSLKTWRDVFADPLHLRADASTRIWLSFTATSIALLLAYPVALFLFRTESRFRGAARRDRRSCRCWSPASCASSAGWRSSAIAGMVNTLAQSLGLTSAPVRLRLQLDRRHDRPRREHHALHDPGAARRIRPARPHARGSGAQPRRFAAAHLPARDAAARACRRSRSRRASASCCRCLPTSRRSCSAAAASSCLRPRSSNRRSTNTNWPMAAALALYTLALHACAASRLSHLAARRLAAHDRRGSAALDRSPALVYALILAPIVVVVVLAFSADNFILFPPSRLLAALVHARCCRTRR